MACEVAVQEAGAHARAARFARPDLRNSGFQSRCRLVGSNAAGELMRENITMSRRQHLDLSTFDARLLDGLEFCRSVYDLFEQVRGGLDGIAKLRLRPTKTEKRLLEELIPVARYLQARYREGRRIKVRWFGGSQPYDAIPCPPARWSSIEWLLASSSLRLQRPSIKMSTSRVDCSMNAADPSVSRGYPETRKPAASFRSLTCNRAAKSLPS